MSNSFTRGRASGATWHTDGTRMYDVLYLLTFVVGRRHPTFANGCRATPVRGSIAAPSGMRDRRPSSWAPERILSQPSTCDARAAVAQIFPVRSVAIHTASRGDAMYGMRDDVLWRRISRRTINAMITVLCLFLFHTWKEGRQRRAREVLHRRRYFTTCLVRTDADVGQL